MKPQSQLELFALILRFQEWSWNWMRSTKRKRVFDGHCDCDCYDFTGFDFKNDNYHLPNEENMFSVISELETLIRAAIICLFNQRQGILTYSSRFISNVQILLFSNIDWKSVEIHFYHDHAVFFMHYLVLKIWEIILNFLITMSEILFFK